MSDTESRHAFAAPRGPVQPRSDRAVGVWRSGSTLVARSGARLPDRCVKCNAADAVSQRLEVRYHDPWMYLLIFAGLIPYAIAVALGTRSGVVRMSLCQTHRARATVLRLGTPLGALAVGLFGMMLAARTELQGFLLLPIGAVLVAIVLPRRVLYATAIDGNRLELGGAGPAFLAELPELDLAAEAAFDRTDLDHIDP